jgi:hypothetical protein
LTRIEAGQLTRNEIGRVITLTMWNGEHEGDAPEQAVTGTLLRVTHEHTPQDPQQTVLDVWAIAQRVTISVNPGIPVELGDTPRVWPVPESIA